MSRAQQLLQRYWGHTEFRPLQAEIIQAAVAGQDILALLPTGGGKSICFQLAGLLRGGLTLVVSPLIALMKDQVDNLNRRGLPATYINSTLPQQEMNARLRDCHTGKYLFLYVAPERLDTEAFLAHVRQLAVKLVAVDEAHCVSQWGHDFRPAYLRIAAFRQQLAGVPLLALTATATPRVRQDIVTHLGLQQAASFVGSFARPNLRFAVSYDENRKQVLCTMLRRLAGAAIVYARSRAATVQLAHELRQEGFSADAYHAGMAADERAAVQQAWLENRMRIIVATNAFGMGIDKSDVRLVAHWHLPADLESYYQEAGRAGRDGQTAFAVALHSPGEQRQLERQLGARFVSWEELVKIYQSLADALHIATDSYDAQQWLPLDLPRLAKATGIYVGSLFPALKKLEEAGLIQLQESEEAAPMLQLLANPADFTTHAAQHPAILPLVNKLLRELDSSAYHSPRPIALQLWARQLQLTEPNLHSLFLHLTQVGLLRYTAAAKAPHVRALALRQQLNKQQLGWQQQQELQAHATARLKALLTYAGSMERCRSRMLREYFGEQTLTDCGRCDVCVGRHSEEVTSPADSVIRQEVRSLLHRRTFTFTELLGQLRQGLPPQRLTVLRNMMADEEIELQEGFLLALRTS